MQLQLLEQRLHVAEPALCDCCGVVMMERVSRAFTLIIFFIALYYHDYYSDNSAGLEVERHKNCIQGDIKHTDAT